jgi:hypothetical protein
MADNVPPPPSLRPPEKLSFWDQVKATAAVAGEKAQEAAAKAKVVADAKIKEIKATEQYARAQEKSSDVWRQTKEGGARAWSETQVQASRAKEGATEAIRGKSRDVTFQEAKLGMTLAREQGGEHETPSNLTVNLGMTAPLPPSMRHHPGTTTPLPR